MAVLAACSSAAMSGTVPLPPNPALTSSFLGQQAVPGYFWPANVTGGVV
jgi:hypothetical protein